MRRKLSASAARVKLRGAEVSDPSVLIGSRLCDCSSTCRPCNGVLAIIGGSSGHQIHSGWQTVRSRVFGRAGPFVVSKSLRELPRSFRRLAGWADSPRMPGLRCDAILLRKRPNGKAVVLPRLPLPCTSPSNGPSIQSRQRHSTLRCDGYHKSPENDLLNRQ